MSLTMDEQMRVLFQSYVDPLTGRMSLGRWKLLYTRLVGTNPNLALSCASPEEIFHLLDRHCNGFITQEDFLQGFQSSHAEEEQQEDNDDEEEEEKRICSGVGGGRHLFANYGQSSSHHSSGQEEILPEDIGHYFNDEMQGTIFRIYELVEEANPDLLKSYELLIRFMCQSLQFERKELDRLEVQMKRKDKSHERQLMQYEEDLKMQLEKVETIARLKERERFEKELHILMEQEKENHNKWLNEFVEMHKLEEVNALASSHQQAQTIQQMQEDLSFQQERCDYLSKRLDESESELRVVKIDFHKSLARLQECERLLSKRSVQLEECAKENDALRQHLSVVERLNLSLRQSKDRVMSPFTDSGHGEDIQDRPQSLPNYEIPGRASVLMESSANSTLHDVAELESEMESCASSLPYDDSLANQIQPIQAKNRLLSPKEINQSCTLTLVDDKGPPKRGMGRARQPITKLTSKPPQSQYNFRTFSTTMKRDGGESFQLVMAGDSGVGKTSFINRLSKNEFIQNTLATLCLDYHNVQCEVESNPVYLQIWDTAGQERFRSLAKSYFRRAHAVILLYDCVSETSFISVREWLEVIKEHCSPHIPVMIVANKIDMRSEYKARGCRVISTLDGLKIAQELDTLFIEASVKDNSNIHEAVYYLAKRLLSNANGSGANKHQEAFTLMYGTKPPVLQTGCCN